MKALLSLILLLGSAQLVFAQGAAEQFTGVWNLVVIERHQMNGDPLPLNRPYSDGQMIFTAGGHFALQQSRPNRQAFPGEDPTEEEARPAFMDYGARYGLFTVDEGDATLTQRPQNSMVASDGDYRVTTYGYEFTGDRLVLSLPPRSINDPNHRFDGITFVQSYIWQRAE